MDERALTEADLPAVQALIRRALDADGGLELAAEAAFARSRYLAGPGLAVAAPDGALVAVAALGPPKNQTASGVVDPAWRGRGLGRRLLAWSAENAGPHRLVVASETLSDGAERLYRRHGLVPIFGELVMSCPLPAPAPPRPPAGVTFEPWSDAVAADFFAAYSASFADRPGFPGTPQDEWVADTVEDDGFDPDLSLLARGPAGEPVGFLTAADDWISQTGVVPLWRRRGLGRATVASALAGFAAAGHVRARLTVATDNPGATALYRDLGFTVTGRRGRFAAP